MPNKRRVVDSRRRKPIQARAESTVAVILEATAQILQKEGRGALNTNRIAERAGISVGTLYQYFPNKHAILLEIARQEIERDRAVVIQEIIKASSDTRHDPTRSGIRALITSQRKQSKVRRAAFDALLAEGLSEFGSESSAAFQEVTALIAMNRERLFSKRARIPSAAMLFVISRAVAGVIRSAIVEDSLLLNSPELEDELVTLVRSYFTVREGRTSKGHPV
jgi:AcrR family transcriptional regulator